MPDTGVAQQQIAVGKRSDATLTVYAPEGDLNGVSLQLYVRAGLESAPEPIGPAPYFLRAQYVLRIPGELLQIGPEVFVESTFVIKQPAKIEGKLRLSGQLQMGSYVSPILAVTVDLLKDVTGALNDLTWWFFE